MRIHQVRSVHYRSNYIEAAEVAPAEAHPSQFLVRHYRYSKDCAHEGDAVCFSSFKAGLDEFAIDNLSTVQIYVVCLEAFRVDAAKLRALPVRTSQYSFVKLDIIQPRSL